MSARVTDLMSVYVCVCVCVSVDGGHVSCFNELCMDISMRSRTKRPNKLSGRSSEPTIRSATEEKIAAVSLLDLFQSQIELSHFTHTHTHTRTHIHKERSSKLHNRIILHLQML